MSYQANLIDISNEFTLRRYAHGIMLAKPHINNHNQTFENMMKLPMGITFNLPGCTSVLPNESLVDLMGLNSTKDMIGTTPLKWVKNNGDLIVKQHNHVIERQQMLIVDQEDVSSSNQMLLQALTMIYPWYSSDSKIMGTISFSIFHNTHSLSRALSALHSLGLLNSPLPLSASEVTESHHLLHDIHFSKRERECIRLVMAGKKSKEIAVMLSLSHRTVENYIDNVKHKLNVSTKVELILKIKELSECKPSLFSAIQN